MKILELRFKNLNSLYGEWNIDFTAPEYISDGIFALTGPTGAGKSTILDAICLALYGATPRLGKITKSGNEIMSRQTGECYAEVVFESQIGKFRCIWEQRRSRKKADGVLQSPRHEIADAVTEKLLENKKSIVANIIEEKTGMDFERFTRSILLAQGGFDSFLKADVEKKSKILEQITGTEIYTEISCRVHERQREERDKLTVLQSEILGIEILNPEQEKELQKVLITKQKDEVDLNGKVSKTGKAIAWLTEVNELNKEISSLKDESLKLTIETDMFKTDLERLAQSQKASTLDGSYATIEAIRKQQLDDKIALNKQEKILPEQEKVFETQTESLKSAERLINKTKENLKVAIPLIKKVRSLDQKLVEKNKTITKDEEICKNDLTKIEVSIKERSKVQNKYAKAEKNLESVKNYFIEHSHDEWLVSGLTGVEEQLGSLLSKKKEIVKTEGDQNKAKTSLKKADKILKDHSKQFAAGKMKQEESTKKLQKVKKSLSELLGDRLLREFRNEKETLLREMSFMKKISELEDYRIKLEDGKQCPLCGGIEHPFAKGNIPEPDEIEKKINKLNVLINKADDLEIEIKKLEDKENLARKNLAEIEKLEAITAKDKESAEKSVSDVKITLEKVSTEFIDLKKVVTEKLRPLGIEDIPDSDVTSLLESLSERLKTWKAQVNKRTETEKQIYEMKGEIKRVDAIIETQSIALKEKNRTLDILRKEFSVESDERKNIFGTKKTDDEERCLNKAISDAEEAEKKVRKVLIDLQQRLTSIKTEIDSYKKRIILGDNKLKKLEEKFSLSLEKVGFSDEKKFIEAQLPKEVRDALLVKKKELDDKGTALKARSKDREARFEAKVAKKITSKTLEELEPQFEELGENLKQLRDVISGYKQKLAVNLASKELIKERKSAIEVQKKECNRWEKLHGLIGSADGKKYRNFAQGLTFELMVSHANRELEKMSDRYLLIRDGEQPLELNVVDNYQAGEIRSTKNLSGGESFIVSLTLALGLSKMASRKVRIDSLFLDEGFGTLDEESLETALETLSGLQQDGKLIGVISHVAALKERIPTQIMAAPASGGRSILIGPGVKRT